MDFEPVKLSGDYTKDHGVIEHEINRNGKNIHSLRGEINLASMRGEDRDREDRNDIERDFRSILVKFATLDAKVIAYASVTGVIAAAVVSAIALKIFK